MNYLDKLEEVRKPSTNDILKRRKKGREHRAAMLKRIKAGEDTEPAEQTGKIPGPKPGDKASREDAHTAYQQIGDIIAETMQLAMADAGFDDDESTRASIQANTPQGRGDRRKRGRGRNQGRRKGDAGRSQIR